MRDSLFDIVFHIIRDWRGYHRRPMVEALAKNCQGVAKLLVVEPALCLPSCALKSLSGHSVCPRLPRRELGMPSCNEKCRPMEFARCYRLPRMEEISDNLWVLRPWALIPYVSPFSRVVPLSRTYRASQIRHALATLGFNAPRFAYINHPYWAEYIGVVQETHLVYECRDDNSVRSQGGPPDPYKEALELQLLKHANVVFVSSWTLQAKMARLHCNVHYLSNGVDFELFSRATSDTMTVPPDLQQLPRPRIGYIGGIWPLFDFDLLKYLSDVRPQWSFVLIGHPNGVPDAIRGKKNIHLLGSKPHEELPRYLKGFDVAIKPWVRNSYVDYANPLTIWEYLAAGKVVVSTSPTDISMTQPLTDVIFVAGDREQFLSCIEQALSGNHSLRIEQGIALAREHSWLHLTKKVPEILGEVVSRNE